MGCSISSIYISPVKSLSFQNLKSCVVNKNIGIINDRIFAFTRNIDSKKAKLIEKIPNERKLNYFLTLKNSPSLNKYNFIYDNNKLIFTTHENYKEIISASIDNLDEISALSSKLLTFLNLLNKPIFLIKNNDFPFFDTSSSNKVLNSISLINLNSILDFEKKIGQKVEFERFRANFYVEGIDAWEERKWINKVIKINNVSFKVQKQIIRCSAINLRPRTDNLTSDLLFSLKQNYNHSDMGIYLNALDDGKIQIGDKLILNNKTISSHIF